MDMGIRDVEKLNKQNIFSWLCSDRTFLRNMVVLHVQITVSTGFFSWKYQNEPVYHRYTWISKSGVCVAPSCGKIFFRIYSAHNTFCVVWQMRNSWRKEGNRKYRKITFVYKNFTNCLFFSISEFEAHHTPWKWSLPTNVLCAKSNLPHCHQFSSIYVIRMVPKPNAPCARKYFHQSRVKKCILAACTPTTNHLFAVPAIHHVTIDHATI